MADTTNTDTTSDSYYTDLLQSLLDENAGKNGADAYSIDLTIANLLQSQNVSQDLIDLTTADHTDAFGNSITYDPVTGWTVEATPETQAILDAQQAEQLQGLTTDASQTRSNNAQQDQRAQLGDDAFTKAFNEYQYRNKPTEETYIGQAQKDLRLDRKKGLSDTAALVQRGMLRGGSGADFASAFKTANDQFSSESDGILNQGRQQGMNNFINVEGAKDAQAQKELQYYQGVADDTPNTTLTDPGYAQSLDNASTQALTALIQSISSGQGDQTALTQQLIAALQAQG